MPLFQAYQLEVILPSFPCSIGFWLFSKVHVLVFLFFFSLIFALWSHGTAILLFLLFYSFRVFHTSVSWWSSTGICVTGSLLKFPGVFSVFWPFSIMQYFGWSRLVLLFPSPPVLVTIVWWIYQEHQLQLVWHSLSCSTVFFSLPLEGQGTYNSFSFFSVLLYGLLIEQSPQVCKF